MKKKKRYKLKKGRIIIALVLLVSIIIFILNIGNIVNYVSLKNLNYNKTTIKLINENELKIDKYSKTLEEIINSKYFIKDNLEYYLDIDYVDKTNFLEDINKLISLGYNTKEINTIYKKLDNIDYILQKEYNKNILNILNSDYFKEDNLDRYWNYNGKDIVLEVNMYLDYEFYTHDILIENVDNFTIVNKYYKLNENYIPKLETINTKYAVNSRQYLTKDAKENFEKMSEEARKENIYIYSGSAYRSYSYQNTLYNNRVNSDGKEYADKTAAKAGYSEHQTGLAVDVLNGNYEYLDSTNKEYEWLINNSYKYGFILRYPKDKEYITGYTYEPWHFRYLGIEIATILYEKNITYEEYIGMK